MDRAISTRKPTCSLKHAALTRLSRFADNIPGSGPEFIAEVEKGFAMLDTNSTGRVSTRELAQFLDTLSPRDGNHCFSQVMSHFLPDFFHLWGMVSARVARCARMSLTRPIIMFLSVHRYRCLQGLLKFCMWGVNKLPSEGETCLYTRNLNPLKPACRVLNSRGKKTTSRS